MGTNVLLLMGLLDRDYNWLWLRMACFVEAQYGGCGQMYSCVVVQWVWPRFKIGVGTF